MMVTGARQVGKTTLLKKLGTGRRFVSLDDPTVRDLARNDPALFLQTYRPPVLIDEFQYAPELLPYVKMDVDAHADECGRFWLTGSQQFKMMREVGESLAGRVGILPLGGLTQREAAAADFAGPFDVLRELDPDVPFPGQDVVYGRIHRGSYPAVVSGRTQDVQTFYRSYLNTYVERDVRRIAAVSDESRFLSFIRVLAARTGCLLNLSEIGKEVGISQPTVKSWLSVLESSGIVCRLHPYSANLNARIVKTPKVYFMDTGLCCYLTGWLNAETLAAGAMNGAMLETYVVSEIVRSFWNAGREAPVWFYRDKSGSEIDLLIERDGRLFPVEIKRTATPTAGDVRNIRQVAAKGLSLADGALVCLVEHTTALPGGVRVIPVGSI